MGAEETTQGSENRPAESTPPVETPPVQQQSHTQSEPDWAKDLRVNLAALPEQMARSIKEAIGTPKPATADKPAEETKQETKQESKPEAETKKHAEPGTNKSGSGNVIDRFNHWWFN